MQPFEHITLFFYRARDENSSLRMWNAWLFHSRGAKAADFLHSRLPSPAWVASYAPCIGRSASQSPKLPFVHGALGNSLRPIFSRFGAPSRDYLAEPDQCDCSKIGTYLAGSLAILRQQDERKFFINIFLSKLKGL